MSVKKWRKSFLAAMLTSGMLVSELSGTAGILGGAVDVWAKLSDYPIITEDFEADDVSAVKAATRGPVTLSLDTEQFNNGKKSLKVTGRAANWNGAFIATDLEAFTGSRVHISAYVKSSDAYVKMSGELGSTYPAIADVNTANMDEWTLIEGEYDVLSNTAATKVYLETDKTADIYIDDVKIEAVAELKEPPAVGEQVLSNCGFEENADGWTASEGCTAELSDTQKLSGDKSLYITGNKEASVLSDVSGYMNQDAVYEVSYSVYAPEADETAADTSAVLIVGEGENAQTITVNEEYESKTERKGDWLTKTANYVIPKGADVSAVSLKITSKNTSFYLDDVSLKQQKILSLQTDGVAKKLGMSNPLTDTKYGADPFAMEYDGRLYIYSTNDTQQFDAEEKDANGFPKKDNGYGDINTINVMSTADMVNWTDHGVIHVGGKEDPEGIAKWARNSWAPAAAHKTIDGKEKFFLYFADNGSGIGVLEADSPVGPFREPETETGSHLIARGMQQAEGVVWLFDPAVFVDDDGTGYLYYGGGVDGVDQNMPKTSRVVKLKDNMVEVDGDAEVIEAPSIFEDSGIHKYNNKYYYTYCSNFSNTDVKTGTGNICAMVSDNPMGPFTYDNIILANPSTFFGVGGNNHHAVFSFKDKWYITYHAQTLGKAVGSANGYRSVHIDELTYDADGHINPITGTYDGVAQLENFNPYEKVEAETFAWQSGISLADCTEDGAVAKEQNRMLNNIVTNSWIALGNVDFGTDGADKFTASIANNTAGGKIELYLDDITGTPVASLDITEATAGEFKDMTWDVSGITGVHRLFMVFKGRMTSDGMKMDYWKFSRSQEQQPGGNQPGGDQTGVQQPNDQQTNTQKPSDQQTNTQKPSDQQTNNQQTTATDELKGKTFTSKKLKYKVLSCTEASKTVMVTGSTNKKVKSVTIPSTVSYNGQKFKVTEIASSAWKKQTKLTKVTIGKNVTKIGANAFSGAKKLKSVIIKGKQIKSIGKKAFNKTNKSITFKVPKGKNKSYKKLLEQSGLKKCKIK